MAKARVSKAIPPTFKCPNCGTTISAEEARGMYIATPASKGQPFEEDQFGNFRIKVGEVSSQWTRWTDMAEVVRENKRYFAVSKKSAYAKHFPGGVILSEPLVAAPIIEVATKPKEEVSSETATEAEVPA